MNREPTCTRCHWWDGPVCRRCGRTRDEVTDEHCATVDRQALRETRMVLEGEQ